MWFVFACCYFVGGAAFASCVYLLVTCYGAYLCFAWVVAWLVCGLLLFVFVAYWSVWFWFTLIFWWFFVLIVLCYCFILMVMRLLFNVVGLLFLLFGGLVWICCFLLSVCWFVFCGLRCSLSCGLLCLLRMKRLCFVLVCWWPVSMVFGLVLELCCYLLLISC